MASCINLFTLDLRFKIRRINFWLLFIHRDGIFRIIFKRTHARAHALRQNCTWKIFTPFSQWKLEKTKKKKKKNKKYFIGKPWQTLTDCTRATHTNWSVRRLLLGTSLHRWTQTKWKIYYILLFVFFFRSLWIYSIKPDWNCVRTNVCVWASCRRLLGFYVIFIFSIFIRLEFFFFVSSRLII